MGHSQLNKRLFLDVESINDSQTLLVNKGGDKNQKRSCKEKLKFKEMKTVYKDRQADEIKGKRLTKLRYWLIIYTQTMLSSLILSDNLFIITVTALLFSFIHILVYFVYLVPRFEKVEKFRIAKIPYMIYNKTIIRLELISDSIINPFVKLVNRNYCITKTLYPSGLYVVCTYLLLVVTVLSRLS